MASHNGLKYILETKYGYIMENGEITSDKDLAMVIDFRRFGFGVSALKVYQELGFNNQKIIESGIKLCTIIPPFEGRDFAGYDYYIEMGYSRDDAYAKSSRDYYNYNLNNNDNYVNYIKKMKKELFEYYRCHAKSVYKLENLNLYELNDRILNNGVITYYSTDERLVYRYKIKLKNPHVEKYFNFLSEEAKKYYNNFQQDGLIEYFKEEFENNKFQWGLHFDSKLIDIKIENDELIIYLDDWSFYNGSESECAINKVVEQFYEEREMHITRMFGSFILLIKENGKLIAKEATNIPIKYCPLMVKLLKEVGGDVAVKLLETLKTEDFELQRKMMCNLINEIVIKGGYFDTNRPLNSCDANVTFGASETMYSALKSNLIDASVIVSNNLGTIITTTPESTQGAVKRMTGLFYTTPSNDLIKLAKNESIIPVFPYYASIDQSEGVRSAIKLGYKKIAVSVAYEDNYLHEYFNELEKEYGVTIYKFGLCSTSISEETAKKMMEYADVIWSCASMNVKKYIESNAIFQVGLKIPVYIMTNRGLEIVKNHLVMMDENFDVKSIKPNNGEERPVVINSKEGLKLLKKENIGKCIDCPYPCV